MCSTSYDNMVDIYMPSKRYTPMLPKVYQYVLVSVCRNIWGWDLPRPASPGRFRIIVGSGGWGHSLFLTCEVRRQVMTRGVQEAL